MDKINIKRVFKSNPKVWKHTSITVLIFVSTTYLALFIGGGIAKSFNGLINLAFIVLIGFISIMLGHLITQTTERFQKIPQPFRWTLAGAFFLIFPMMVASLVFLKNAIMITLYILLTSSFLGFGIACLIDEKEKRLNKFIPIIFTFIGAIGLGGLILWITWEGYPYRGPDDLIYGDMDIKTELSDPSDVGEYDVLKLTYGSGKDKQRESYGQEVDIVTASVDISKMLDKPNNLVMSIRNKYWGFDLGEAPLNAHVWYPDGEGPFPLVMIVHGNHMMDDFSELGYEYLGELLASRGYIVASIDQNFLNGGGFLEAILGGLSNENNARSYLLLEHLKLWDAWNDSEETLFKDMVDIEKIALIGHSRGGEAVSTAAAFNQLSYHPDNSDIEFDFEFKIESVISIAPSYGQFQPRRQDVELKDINYLVLHGSSDGDVSSFQGLHQYDAISFSENSDAIKSAIYIEGANHGQFNTSWGRIDFPISRFFLDRGNIISDKKQIKATKIFISSFLEDTLKKNSEYRAVIREPYTARKWIDNVNYYIQSWQGGNLTIANFEEDMDLTSTSIHGGKSYGRDLISWSEESVELASGNLRKTASLKLEWIEKEDKVAEYSLSIPRDQELGRDIEALIFSASNISENREEVDFIVSLVDHSGEKASLALSSISSLLPSPEYRMFKKPMAVQSYSEPIFTTYSFPISNFQKANNLFNPMDIAEIKFTFNNSSGKVYLDDIGFTFLN